MRRAVALHPDMQCPPVANIKVDVVRSGPGRLSLRYAVNGTISDLELPPIVAPSRADELWKHTCFEAFIRAEGDTGYFEFNFSPSTQWAAYHFDSYRSGMRPADDVAEPKMSVSPGEATLTLDVLLDLEKLAPLRDGGWQLGLSAIIETRGGSKSYWALAHPPGKPDFHHADCFALELPQISAA